MFVKKSIRKITVLTILFTKVIKRIGLRQLAMRYHEITVPICMACGNKDNEFDQNQQLMRSWPHTPNHYFSLPLFYSSMGPHPAAT